MLRIATMFFIAVLDCVERTVFHRDCIGKNGNDYNFQMDVNYINPLLEATTSVLGTMASLKTRPGKPSLKGDSNTLADVTGVINLKGKKVNGWMAVGFYEGTILAIAEKMLHEKFESIDYMVVDLVGELTNMISGSARSIYSDKGFLDIEMALPEMVVGKNKKIQRQIFGHAVLLPFTSNVGDFCVEFSIE